MRALHGASWRLQTQLYRMSRDEAAKSADMDWQTLRDWVIRYNEYGLDGLADRPRDGRRPKLDPEEKAEHIRIVLARICKERFAKSLRVTSMGHPARARPFATKDSTQPRGKGPDRTSGL
jgi:hypothetical protein